MKNSLRRIFALALVVMMIASLGMSAMADEPTAITSITFTKTLEKEANVYNPNTTYTFTITSATEGLDSTKSIYAGPLGAVAFTLGEGQAHGKVGENTNNDQLIITSTPALENVTFTGTISITASEFPQTGIYKYVVTESGSYNGMTFDSTPRSLEIMVTKDANNEKVVTAAVLYYTADGQKVRNFVNKYETANLTIEKVVDGNMGEKDKSFAFTVMIDGDAGEKYHAIVPGITDPVVLEADKAYDFSLTHGQKVQIFGLSVNDKYTVTEKDYSNDGYVTSATVNGATATLTQSGEGEKRVNGFAAVTVDKVVDGEEEFDQTVVFTNTKSVNVPTGIAMTVLPFVAMLAMAAVVAILFFRKKERREA